MNDDLACCLGCLFVIFVIFAGFSLFGAISNFHWDTHDLSDAYLSEYESGVVNTSFIRSNGSTDLSYMYYVYFGLSNVSSEFIDSEVVTYFYEGDNLVVSNTYGSAFNNTTEKITEDKYANDRVFMSSYYHVDKFANITHVVIVVIKDGKILFNSTQPFNMTNYENSLTAGDSDNGDMDNNSTLNSSDSSSSRNYVGSSNSNKFHEPSCSQAKKIKEGNEIIFSSREDAMDSGYTPCGICHP